MKTEEKLKAQVWLHRKLPNGSREVLIFRTTPARGNFWQPITGSAEKDETGLEAAIREAREESSLPIDSFKMKSIDFSFRFSNSFGQFVEYVFECEVTTATDNVIIDSKEHVEYCWTQPEDAFSRLRHESNKEALRILRQKWLQD